MTGLFNDRESAESAYQALSSRGYREKDINVVMSDDTRKKHFSGPGATETELGNKAAEGAGVGGAVGGTVVGIAAAVAAIGSNLVIPGLGLVVAGPLAAGLAGAGAGAGAGGLIGALVGWNIPEERVKHYEAGLKERIVISEFPSVENANNAYNSPAYQDALKALGNGAVRDIRIVEGLE